MKRSLGLCTLITISASALASCLPVDRSGMQEVQATTESCMSVDAIRANIAALDGRPVVACGVFNYEFEDINLYQDTASARDYSTTRCLSLSLPAGTTQDFSAMSGRRVRIEAVASADFCPEGVICAASCSESGLHVNRVTPLE